VSRIAREALVAEDRLTSSDKRALLLWVLLGIVGVVFAHKYFFQAFPEASVDFKVSREEALSRAQKFVGSLGEDVSTYQTAIVFDVDDNAKTYLEREMGLQQANQLMSTELHIWYWKVRFFRPKQEEEFRVRLSPAGQIVGYGHAIEEKRAGPELDRDAARARAESFLSGKLGMNLANWDFLAEETSSHKLPNRMDWEFTWEKHGFKAKDAPYQLKAVVDGDRVNGSREFLKVPEDWERGYKRLRSSNDTLTLAFVVPYLLLLGAAVALAMVLTRKGQTTWGLAIKAGVLVAVLLFLKDLNDWPLWAASYDTTDAYGSFLASKIATSLLVALLTAALTVTAIVPSAEALYRTTQPGRLRLAKAFTLRGVRTKEFFSSAVVGVSLAAVHIGYLTAFYIIAGHIGAWAPQELNYENSASTAFPWIAGVAIGVTAATSEEFLFRLFAIPFFHRLTRSRWIAVILPAFLWSFLHSNYPQEPAYVRGIEIGVMGILAGIVMLRWGILATLIWHYTVDASLVGLLLIRSSSPYLKISGVIVGAAALLPMAYGAFAYLKRGSFETDEELFNRAAPISDVSFSLPTAVSETPVRARRYDALSGGKILFLAACLLFGGAVVWKLRVPQLGDYLKVSVNAREATARAGEILREHGLNPASYHHATVLANVTDPFANEFLRERIGIEGLNNIYSGLIPGALWRVRYFRDGQAEEYAVILKPDGSLHSLHHTLGENTPGASLTKDEAVARAEKFLREEKKLDLAGWSLVEASPEKQPHRIDYQLTWQQDATLDAGNISGADSANHAHARFELDVLGDEPSNYRTYIKIPEEWVRKHDETTLGSTILGYGVPILFFGGLGMTALILFLRNLRSEAARAIPWKRISIWAGAGLIAFVLSFALGSGIANSMNLYRTEIPFKAMIATLAIGFALGAAFDWGGLALLLGTAWYYAVHAFGEDRIPAGGNLPALYYRDALWIGLGGSGASIGLNRLLAWASAHWPTVHRSMGASFGHNLDAVLPSGAVLAGTILQCLFYVGFLAIVAAFVASMIKAPWLRLLLFLMGALALTGSSWGNGADFAKQFLAQVILLGFLVVAVRWVTRFNILGIILVVAFSGLLGGATLLLEQPNSFYRMNGYALLLLMGLLLAWPLFFWQARRASVSLYTGSETLN
jgi:membrane protease YdiL (CAAX protease family)